MDEKEKLISLKVGLEIVKKYDENGEMNFVNSLLKGEVEELEQSLSPEEFNEMVHDTITSYTNVQKKTKK